MFYEQSKCDTGLISHVQQFQMSCGPHNIVLGGMGVHVKHKDEEVERSMVFNHFIGGVPRTFGNYCSSLAMDNIMHFI